MMGKKLVLATEALLRLNGYGLLTDEELVYKLKQAYIYETSQAVEQQQDSFVGQEEPVLEEIPPKVVPRAVYVGEPNKARIDALRKGLR